MKKGMLFVILLMLSSILATAVVEEGVKEPETLAVEADIPDYLPPAEILQHPTKFFSGHPLRLRGDFSGLDLESVQVELQGTETGVQRTLEVRRATPGYVSVNIPPEIPTDRYDVILRGNGKTYETTVEIYGFTPEKLQPMGGGGAVEEHVLPSAILYQSKLRCGFCYWESVLAGHPKNPDQLVLTGTTRTPSLSTDGGRTWLAGTLDGILYYGDPSSLITPDGMFLLAGNGEIDNPSNQECPRPQIGVLYSGHITSRVFLSTVFKQPPITMKPSCTASDFPKITYDPNTNNVYITAWGVAFEDGSEGPALFTSRDGGNSFLEQKLEYAVGKARSSPLSVDVTPWGDLRVVVVFDRYFHLLRFDREAKLVDIAKGLDVSGSGQAARVSATSTRYWLVWTGPEIAIDKSNRHPGRIYVVWAVPEEVVKDPSFSWNGMYGKNLDIFLAYSDDDGVTWTHAQKVNDDTGHGDQVFPSIDIDTTGVVHVVFLDKRENPDLPQYDVYYAKLLDGKVSRNIRVNPSHVPNALGYREPGDYLGMVVAYPEKTYISYPCGSWQDVQAGDACLTALDPNLVPFPGEFKRGDSNQDLKVDISDAINILGYLFTSSGVLKCKDAADANDDGEIDISDAVFLLDYLFKGAEAPPAPFPNPGLDPTEDRLNC